MEQLIYFDNAATSFPKPAPVYTYMDQFFRRAGVNPGRSGYDLCIDTGRVDFIAAREMIVTLVESLRRSEELPQHRI